MPTAKSLTGLKIGIASVFWAGLDDCVKPVADAAKKKLADAGVVFVEASTADLAGSKALNDSISFPIGLCEPVAAIPDHFTATANNAPVSTVATVIAEVANPDLQGALGAILGDVHTGSFSADIVPTTGDRAHLQKLYTDYFFAAKVACALFPTTFLATPKIDATHGFSIVGCTVDGIETTGPTFCTCIRNIDPCINAGIPSVSIPVGLTAFGLPVACRSTALWARTPLCWPSAWALKRPGAHSQHLGLIASTNVPSWLTGCI